VIKAAAVSDYRPAVRAETKIKKGEETLTVSLHKNPDILAAIGKEKEDRIVVGFSMETDRMLEHARAKLTEKGLDFIVANDVTEPGQGSGPIRTSSGSWTVTATWRPFRCWTNWQWPA